MLRNNTSFPLQITTKLEKIYKEYSEINSATSPKQNEEIKLAILLKYYQYLIRTIIADPEYNPRGLLIYHKMGLGKTYLAISIVLSLMDQYKPMLIAPKALHNNFKQSFQDIIKVLYQDKFAQEAKMKRVMKSMKFVSMDAYNMIDQLMKASGGDTERISQTLIIVDEAHNLFRGVINSSNENTNAKRFYDLIMNSPNIKLIF